MKLEELIKKNKEKFTQTDLAIADFLIDNKNDELDLSINELAKKCLTSRTSILRFTQKIGFGGYSEFKYFLKEKDHRKKDQTKKEDKKLNQILESLDKANNIFIYGNGDFEDIIKKSIKSYLKDLGKLSETFQGRDEISTFNKNSLKDSTIFIIDLSDDPNTLELLSLISNLNTKKILITDTYSKSFLGNYTIHIKKLEKNKINSIAKNLEEIEKFFVKYQEYRMKNESKWFNKRKLRYLR